MITVKNIHKYFGENHVLEDVSFTFETGKINLIIGKSGSGKTVLLKSIVGLHTVDSGEILYDQRSWTNISNRQQRAIRSEMGMVFQGGALFDSMTVGENISFPLVMFSNKSRKEIEIQMENCLEQVNLKGSKNLYPAEISGGMQKRVAIARAIALQPKYLFFDEPNSGLDPITSIVIDDLIKKITENSKGIITTIINTHDMNTVLELGDNILFLDAGKKQWEGNKEEILSTNNASLNDFVFASKLYKKIKHTAQ